MLYITDAELLAMHPDLQKTQVDSLQISSATELCSNIKGTTKTAFKTSSALGRPCLTELFPGFQVLRVKNISLSHPNTPFYSWSLPTRIASIMALSITTSNLSAQSFLKRHLASNLQITCITCGKGCLEGCVAQNSFG